MDKYGVGKTPGFSMKEDSGYVTTMTTTGFAAPAPAPVPIPTPLAAEIDLLRVDEAARLLRVNVSTVYRWVAEGRLRAFKIGRVVRVRREDVLDFVQGNLTIG